jgi:hypothetical protein
MYCPMQYALPCIPSSVLAMVEVIVSTFLSISVHFYQFRLIKSSFSSSLRNCSLRLVELEGSKQAVSKSSSCNNYGVPEAQKFREEYSYYCSFG